MIHLITIEVEKDIAIQVSRLLLKDSTKNKSIELFRMAILAALEEDDAEEV